MTFSAGQKLTASALNALVTGFTAIEYVLGTNETRTSTTTMTDSAILVALAANTTYDVDFWCALLGAQAGDFKSQWTFPTSATVYVWQLAPATTLTGAADEGSVNFGARAVDTTSPTTPAFAGVLDTTNPVTMRQRLRVIVGVTSGNLRLQWAQSVSNATATTILAGAKLSARPASSTG
jgi:hypothetical protein